MLLRPCVLITHASSLPYIRPKRAHNFCKEEQTPKKQKEGRQLRAHVTHSSLGVQWQLWVVALARQTDDGSRSRGPGSGSDIWALALISEAVIDTHDVTSRRSQMVL
jgi:hypothetical protein